MSKELNFFSFENTNDLTELRGGGKNLDDENNESITKKYRKKLLELNDKYKKLIQENESLKQENKNLQKINNNLYEELKKYD